MRQKILMLGVLICLLTPAAGVLADSLEIREWLVPWEDTLPRSPYLDSGGRVWFAGYEGDYIGNMKPQDGLFNRYDLPPGTEPQNLIVDKDRNIWFTARGARHIGKMSPSTGQAVRFEMPSRKAKDPHSLAFDSKGDIWFTVHDSNFVGKLSVADGNVQLISIPTRKSRPSAIVVDRDDNPWAVASGGNRLLQIFPATMTMAEIELPDEESRPRKLVTTANGDIWYADFHLGRLGRYRPVSNQFREWPMPGGDDSEPYGMAVDKNDRIWVVESGLSPNRFVGFDTESEAFLNETNIPSGGGAVRHMYYHEPSGEVWFGTDSNYIGRAKVH